VEGRGVEPHPISQDLVFKASRGTIPAALPSNYINENPESFGSRGLGLDNCVLSCQDPVAPLFHVEPKRYSGCMAHPWILGFSDEVMVCCTMAPD